MAEFSYDVALSFAGEDRKYVGAVADKLVSVGVRVFYDEYEPATLWGKDLYVHLRDVYRNRARFTILFASEHYGAKVWTNHERESAQARALQERSEYILPVRFDDSEIPGLLPTTGHVDARLVGPDELVEMVLAKLEIASLHPASAAPPLPGDSRKGFESLRARAAFLAAAAQLEDAKRDLLNSQRGVSLARDSVRQLFDYIEGEVTAINNLDPSITVHVTRKFDIVSVSCREASFTASWTQQYSNSLSDAGLYVREHNGRHSLDSPGLHSKLVAEHYLTFGVDDYHNAQWREQKGDVRTYTTTQVADKYLGRIIEMLFKVAPSDSG
ncbi:MAG: TIR domain-containing protein [Gemmatimonadota bacterium]|nr:TIR domain-containing protein [Gemmatimonadota bacterium]